MPPSFYKKYSAFIEKDQMWITQRIGKNDKEKTAMNWLLFSKKHRKLYSIGRYGNFVKNIFTQNEI